MSEKKLHPLVEIIDKESKYFQEGSYHDEEGHHKTKSLIIDSSKLNTIIVEYLEGVYEKIMHNSATRYPDGHTGPREENTHLRCNILHLPAPDTLLERELTHFLNLTPVHQGPLAATHAKAAIAYLREKGLLKE